MESSSRSSESGSDFDRNADFISIFFHLLKNLIAPVRHTNISDQMLALSAIAVAASSSSSCSCSTLFFFTVPNTFILWVI